MKTVTRSWESVELYAFEERTCLAWVRWEVSQSGGITVGGDRRAVAVREIGTCGPVADFASVSA